MLNLTPKERADLTDGLAKFANDVADLETKSIELLKDLSPYITSLTANTYDAFSSSVNQLDVLHQKTEYLNQILKKS